LPHAGHAADPDGLIQVATEAERLGFESVWVGDHIILPAVTTDYPYADKGQYPLKADRPFVEAFTTLAFVASATSTIRLGVAVCIVPYRPAALLAKIAASLDFLSKGRLILGAASGWSSQEFESLGMPYDRRGRATDEALEFARLAWGSPDGRVTYEGEHVRVRDAYVVPRPPQGADLPIWIGGASRAARRRAAQFGTAWFPPLNETTDLAALDQGIAEVRAAAVDAGRSHTIDLNVMAPISFLDESKRPQWPGELSGTPAELTHRLGTLAEAGVGHIVFQLGGSSRRRIEFMQRFMEEVAPNLAAQSAS
jgi:probable F420-dependent oxidoreductase